MVVTYKIQKGIHKEKCDDCALIGSLVINDSAGCENIEKYSCAFVADGVGGNAGGDEAALFIMEAIKGLEFESINDAKEKLLNINEALIEYGNNVAGHEKMATTVSGLVFKEGKTFLIHCGNTRIYALQGSFLKQITTDQTTYQWLVSTGNIDAADSCNKSEIRGAFGGGTTKFVETLVVDTVFERNIPSKILMTTDGIHDVLTIDQIEDIFTDDSLTSEEIIDQLMLLAVNKGSLDDCTAVIIEREVD